MAAGTGSSLAGAQAELAMWAWSFADVYDVLPECAAAMDEILRGQGLIGASVIRDDLCEGFIFRFFLSTRLGHVRST
jgi:hypothetical protein